MYVISESTAQQIRDLIGNNGGNGNTVGHGSSARLVRYVKCVTWNGSTHQGTGTVEERSSSGWTSFGTHTEMLLLAANGENLSVNRRYLAIQMGRSGSQDIFVAVSNDPVPPELGCGLMYDEDGNIVVDVAALAGDALEAHTSGGTCTIDVVPGCHITLEGGTKVSVDVEGLAAEGGGLEAHGEGACKQLRIKQGCGITLDSEGGITVFSPDVAGHGLEPGSTPCELAVKTGCGITLDSGYGVTVFSPDIAGNGLEPGSTPCELAVKAGCGITVDSTGVKVNASTLAGAGLVPSSYCTLNVNPGCGIKVESDEVKFDNGIVGQGLRKNADGCHFDIDPGCHITLEGGAKIGVDTDSLVGNGLKKGGTGCGNLEVKAACGIFVDEDGVAVKNSDLAGDCLIPDPTTCLLHVDLEPDSETTYTTVTAQSLSASGCSVSLQTTTRDVTVKKNACGLVVDVVLGTPTTSTQTVTTDPNACISMGDLCVYCDGYGTYGGTTPPTPGYCWDSVGKLWVVCAEADPIP